MFDLTHRAIREWMDAGVVDGLRVDHPDGSADPAGYFERLSALSGGSWTVAEKILEGRGAAPGLGRGRDDRVRGRRGWWPACSSTGTA